MFKKQYESHETVTIIFEGKSIDVEIGQTVAAALLGDGHLIFATHVLVVSLVRLIALWEFALSVCSK